MSTPFDLDEIDIKILQNLQREARISNAELADRVGLSPAPCLRRVRALEQAGVIRRYVTLLNPSALNLSVTVFVQVKLDRQVAERFQILEQAILKRPEVLECYVMTGGHDFLLKVVVRDVSAYEEFQREFLSRIESVSSTDSSFALKQVKNFTELPLSYVRNSSEAGAEETLRRFPKRADAQTDQQRATAPGKAHRRRKPAHY